MIGLVKDMSALGSYFHTQEYKNGYDLSSVGQGAGKQSISTLEMKGDMRASIERIWTPVQEGHPEELQGYTESGEPKFNTHPQLSFYA